MLSSWMLTIYLDLNVWTWIRIWVGGTEVTFIHISVKLFFLIFRKHLLNHLNQIDIWQASPQLRKYEHDIP